jgi:hypothetical protein
LALATNRIQQSLAWRTRDLVGKTLLRFARFLPASAVR